MRTRLFLPLLSIAVVLAVGVAPASAASRAVTPTLTSPTSGATVNTSRPKFQWTLPAGYSMDGIEVSSSYTESANGLFSSNVYSRTLPDGTLQNTVPAASGLWAGRWFWHVIGENAQGAPADSVNRSFTIPVRVNTPLLSGVVNSRGLSSFSVRGNLNTKNYEMRVAVYIGSYRCISRIFKGPIPRDLLAVTTAYASGSCMTAGTPPNNTKVRLVATAIGNGVQRSATKVFYT